MNEKLITCHDFHGFKWQNINIYQIFVSNGIGEHAHNFGPPHIEISSLNTSNEKIK
jgi:hypothetical protein